MGMLLVNIVSNGVVILQFDLIDVDKIVIVKVGILFVSVLNVQVNFVVEGEKLVFDDVWMKVFVVWNDWFNMIQIDQVKDLVVLNVMQKVNFMKFYMVLYYVFSVLMFYSDMNGEFCSICQLKNVNGSYLILVDWIGIVLQCVIVNVKDYVYKCLDGL